MSPRMIRYILVFATRAGVLQPAALVSPAYEVINRSIADLSEMMGQFIPDSSCSFERKRAVQIDDISEGIIA